MLSKDYVETIWSRTKARAKRANIPFELTRSDISNMTIPITCPVLGIPLRQERGKRTDNSLSIDRIDPNLGYTVDNVVFVSWRVNWLKNNAKLEEMRKMVEFYSALEAEELYHSSLSGGVSDPEASRVLNERNTNIKT